MPLLAFMVVCVVECVCGCRCDEVSSKHTMSHGPPPCVCVQLLRCRYVGPDDEGPAGLPFVPRLEETELQPTFDGGVALPASMRAASTHQQRAAQKGPLVPLPLFGVPNADNMTATTGAMADRFTDFMRLHPHTSRDPNTPAQLGPRDLQPG